MKASFEAIPSPEHQSFLIRGYDKKGFLAPFHYHPELELTLIEEGFGTRFVGSHMEDFKAGDLILVGSNVPHCWKLSPNCKEASSIVIQFLPDFLGKNFIDIPEMRSLHQLINVCKGGIELNGLLKRHITSNMHQLMREKDPFESMLGLLRILNIISTSGEKDVLHSHAEKTISSKHEEERILVVYNYIQDYFRKDIQLNEASRLAGMTPNGFCKYFKRMTRKTFIEVVTDYRIDLAVQLLINSGSTISNIAYECGYDDVSHFYKTFKKRLGNSPVQYRKKFRAHLN